MPRLLETQTRTGTMVHAINRILRVAAHQTGLAFLGGIESEVIWRGVEGFLPVDDDDLLLTRAWLAWVELWRSEEWLEPTITALRGRERGMLAEAHEFRLSRPDLDLMRALERSA